MSQLQVTPGVPVEVDGSRPWWQEVRIDVWDRSGRSVVTTAVSHPRPVVSRRGWLHLRNVRLGGCTCARVVLGG